MSYEDPIEAALRALTGVVWTKRKNIYDARINKTDCVNIEQTLSDHRIIVVSEVSPARSGRYIASVPQTEIQKILRAVEETGAEVKPHRRKRNT